MITQEKARDLLGTRVRDVHGEDLGTVAAVYVDDQSTKPEFAALRIGESGSALVPLVGAQESDAGVRVGFAREQVVAAPPIEPHDGLTQEEEARLYSHYGVDYTVTVVDEDTIRVHRRANEQDVTAAVEERHEVLVERAPLDGEDIEA